MPRKPGQRETVTLADGTQFTLAPGSRLRLAAADFRAGLGRDVELTGEAYFAVAHDAGAPVLPVHAGRTVARAIYRDAVRRAPPYSGRIRPVPHCRGPRGPLGVGARTLAGRAIMAVVGADRGASRD